MTGVRNVLLGALGLVAFVALCFFGYQGYWHLMKSNVGHQYDVNTGTQQYQAGLISRERDFAIDWNRAVDPAQKDALADQFCQIYPDLKPPPADLVQDHAIICQGR